MTALAIGVLVSALVAVIILAVYKVRKIREDDSNGEDCARWMERMSKRKVENFT